MYIYIYIYVYIYIYIYIYVCIYIYIYVCVCIYIYEPGAACCSRQLLFDAPVVTCVISSGSVGSEKSPYDTLLVVSVECEAASSSGSLGDTTAQRERRRLRLWRW